MRTGTRAVVGVAPCAPGTLLHASPGSRSHETSRIHGHATLENRGRGRARRGRELRSRSLCLCLPLYLHIHPLRHLHHWIRIRNPLTLPLNRTPCAASYDVLPESASESASESGGGGAARLLRVRIVQTF